MNARKKRDTSQKRAEIVAAAVQAFQQDGYDNTSMDRIAEVAGASKRTVYNHFESKESLFGAVIDAFMDRARELKQIEYDPKRELADQLREFASAKLTVLADPEWLGVTKVGLGVLIRDPELAQTTMQRVYGGEDFLVPWLAAADADGRLDVPHPERTAELFWGTVSGAFFWPQVLGVGPTKADAEDLLAHFISSFIAAHEPAS